MKKNYFLIVFYFCYLGLYAQTNSSFIQKITKEADSLKNIEQYDKALKKYEGLIESLKKEKKHKEWISAIDEHYKLLILANKPAKQRQEVLEGIIQYAEKNIAKNTPLLSNAYILVCEKYNDYQFNSEKAWVYANKALENEEQINEKNDDKYIREVDIYLVLARSNDIYYEGRVGNYKKSIDYLKKALTIFSKLPLSKQVKALFTKGKIYNLLGLFYSNVGLPKDTAHQNLDTAIIYYKKSYIIYQKIKIYPLKTAQAASNIGVIYNNSFGTPYKNINYDSAFAYFKKSEEISLHIPKSINYKKLLSDLYFFMWINAEHRKTDSLVYYAHKSLQTIYPLQSDDVFALPDFKNKNHIIDYDQTVKALIHKIMALRNQYTRAKDKKYLDFAYQLCFSMDTLSKYYKQEYAKQHLYFDRTYADYTDMLLDLCALYPARKEEFERQGFYFFETYLNGILDEHNPSRGQLPDSLQTKYKQLKQQYINLDNKKLLTKNKSETEKIDREMTAIFFEEEKLNKYIQQKHPDYYTASQTRKAPQYEEVKQYLNDETVVLVLGFDNHFEKDVFSWCFTKDAVQFRRTPTQLKEKMLRPKMDSFSRAVRREINQSSKIYIDNAYFLYQILIAPHEALLKDKKRLIIISNGKLVNFPYGALHTKAFSYQKNKKIEWKEMPFLVKQFSKGIGFCPSLNNLVANTHYKTKVYANELKMYVPVYDEVEGSIPHHNQALCEHLKISESEGKRGGLSKIFKKKGDFMGFGILKGTLEEAKSIEKLMQSKKLPYQVFYRKDATEDALQKRIDSRILHFPLHSFSNPSEYTLSFIALYQPALGDSTVIKEGKKQDGILVYNEIGLLNLNTSLVVLSSCESGIGELSNNTVMSLGYKFLCSGVPNVLSTLWQIDDEKTGNLMPLFYKYLYETEQKYDYSEALQKMCIDAINNPETAEPYFWAGFQLHYKWEK